MSYRALMQILDMLLRVILIINYTWTGFSEKDITLDLIMWYVIIILCDMIDMKLLKQRIKLF